MVSAGEVTLTEPLPGVKFNCKNLWFESNPRLTDGNRMSVTRVIFAASGVVTLKATL